MGDSNLISTGYSGQSRYILEYLSDKPSKYEVIHDAWHYMGMPIKDATFEDGEKLKYWIHPAGQHPWGKDMLPYYVQKFKPDVFFTLCDSVTEERIIPILDENNNLKFPNMKELYDNYKDNITKIKTLSGKIINGKVEGVWTNISSIERQKANQEVIRLFQKYGETRTTSKHSLIYRKDDELKKITPKEMFDSEQDFVQIDNINYIKKNINYPIDLVKLLDIKNPFSYNEEYIVYLNTYIKRYINRDDMKSLLRILASYISEGCASYYNKNGRESYQIIICNNNKKWLLDIQEDFKKLNLISNINNNYTYRLCNQSRLFYYIIERFCGKYSHNKQIPDFVFDLDEDLQIFFIENLVKGDGSWVNKDTFRFTYTTKSLKLVSQLSFLFKSIGMNTCFTKKNNKYYNICNSGYIDRTRNKQKLYKEQYSKYVYDICIPGTENFVDCCGLVLVHNSFMLAQDGPNGPVNYWFNQINFSPAKTVIYFPSDGEPFPQGCDNTLRKFDYVVAMAKFGQEQVKRLYNIDALYIPHCVDANKFYKLNNKQELKNKWMNNIRDCEGRIVDITNKRILLCVARNSGRKMISHLPKIIEGLFKDPKYADVVMLFKSDPYDAASGGVDMVSLCKQHGVSDRVLWTNVTWVTGYNITEMREIYNLADVFVLPTCLPPEEIIYTLDGIKEIKDVKEGDKIITHTGKVSKVKKVMKYDNTKKMCSIKTLYLEKPIVSTFDHKLFVRRDGVNQFISACEVKKGDYLTFPKYKKEEGFKLHFEECLGRNQIKGVTFKNPRYKVIKDIEIDEDIARLFGYYLAEGCIYQKHKINSLQGIIFSIDTREEEITTDIITIMKNKFRLNGKIYDSTRHRRTIRYYSSSLAKLFKEFFKSGARNKKIPFCIINLPNKILEQFVKGAWLGDGSHSYRKCFNSTMFEYSTTSRDIAYNLFLIMIKLGYLVSVKYQAKKRAYRLRLGGAQKFRFAETLGVELTEKKDSKTYQLGKIDNDYFYIPVLKVGGDVPHSRVVYDLFVESEDHSFCSRVAVHNSGENVGFGVPFIEAMSCSLPLVVTDFTTPRELVDGDERQLAKLANTLTGMFNVERGIISNEDMLEKIKFFLDNPEVAMETGRKNRLKVLKEYDTKKVLPLWDQLFSKIVNE